MQEKESQTMTRHRVWAEINLDNLIFNFKQAQKRAGRRQLLCVVKADAYGHGAVQVAKTLHDAGATYFAVNTPEEAVQLRRHGLMQPILILGMVSPDWIDTLSELNITLTIGDKAAADRYARALGDRRLRVHVKIETGLNRIGFQPQNAVEEILSVADMLCFQIEGIFTHFAAADDDDENVFTEQQQTQFNGIINELQNRGLSIPLRHTANSAAIIAHPESYADMIRPGLMLYGYNPHHQQTLELRPVLSLSTHIIQVKNISPGESVSYSRTWKADTAATVATLGVGYADGLLRSLSGKISMLLHGQRVPQIGRIGMDMCMLDISGIQGVKVGDRVTIIGSDGTECVTADELAAAAPTITNELLCAVGRRVPRVYTRDGVIVEQVSYVDRL